MLFRQKLAFFVFGCVFVIVGQVVTGLVVPSATAQDGLQDAQFRHVTVQRLTVTGVEGNRVIQLRPDDPRGGLLTIHAWDTPDGGEVLALRADEHGGRLFIFRKDQDSSLVSLGVNSYGNGEIARWDGAGTPVTPLRTLRRPTSGTIESHIDGEFKGWEGETIFKLVNGQIWQQSTYAYKYTYKFRPKVTIYPSGTGHKMIVDGVGTIAVRQIK